MCIKSEYLFDIESDEDVNKIIKWWNDNLFEQGYVQMDEFEAFCDMVPEFKHRKYCWMFELTTDNIELCSRKDAHHVKSSWEIKLPEPEVKPYLRKAYND